MKRLIYSQSDIANFSTFEVTDIESIFKYQVEGAKRFISDLEAKRKFSDEVFQFINEAYDELGGFKSFRDMDRFINDSYFWYITYDGPVPADERDLDIDRVYVISVYRRSHGLKMVGLAGRKIARSNSTRDENTEVRARTRAAVAQHLKFMADRGWGEVSDRLEYWCNRVLGDKYVINPEYLKENKVFSNMIIDPYDNHYQRPLRKDGPMLTKIAYGTIKV